MNSDSIVLGVDIGGSHLTAALVNRGTKSFVEGSHARMRVNSAASASEILEVWSGAMNNIFHTNNISKKKIGIAMPGPFDYANGISLIKGLDKYDSLYNVNVKQQLADQLQMSSSDIIMMNDAACFLRGEVYHGAAQGYQHAIGITLGTGTGTAIHHNGITEDANLGPAPFMAGIADEYFSTRWFVKEYVARSGKTIKDVKALSELYASGGPVKEIFSDFVKNLAFFLKGFAEREKPEVIVMGGNIAQCSDLFMEDLEHYLHAAAITVPIVRAKLGEEAAILGASSLFEI